MDKMIKLKMEFDFKSNEEMESFIKDFENKFGVNKGKLRYRYNVAEI